MILSAGATIEDPDALFAKASEALSNASHVEALTFALAAAERGHSGAQFLAGDCFFRGRGTPKNIEKAVSFLQKAADGGEAQAKLLLAMVSLSGNDLGLSEQEVLKLVEEASQANIASAHVLLGQLYMEGRAGAKDVSRAVDLFQKGVECGDSEAIIAMAVLHTKGLGVEKDLNKAYDLAKIARSKGSKDAEALINELRDELWGKTHRPAEKSLPIAIALSLLLGPLGLIYIDWGRAALILALCLASLFVFKVPLLAIVLWFVLPIASIAMLGTQRRSFKGYWNRLKRKGRL